MQLNGTNWTCLQIIKQAVLTFAPFGHVMSRWFGPWQQNCCDGSRQQNTTALKTLFLFVSIDLMSSNGSREALQSKQGEKKQTSWDFLLRLLESRLTSVIITLVRIHFGVISQLTWSFAFTQVTFSTVLFFPIHLNARLIILPRPLLSRHGDYSRAPLNNIRSLSISSWALLASGDNASLIKAPSLALN